MWLRSMRLSSRLKRLPSGAMRGGWRGLQGLKTEKEMWWGWGWGVGKKTRRYNRNGAAVGAEGLPMTPPQNREEKSEGGGGDGGHWRWRFTGGSESLRGSVAAPLMYSDAKCARPGASTGPLVVVVRVAAFDRRAPTKPFAMDPSAFHSCAQAPMYGCARTPTCTCTFFIFIFCHFSDCFFCFFLSRSHRPDLISISMAALWGPLFSGCTC